jgi:hypothetical protein
VWQNIFETRLTFEALTERIKESGLFNQLDIGDNKITGEIKQLDADFKGAGFSEISTPIYIARNHLKGFVLIEFKDRRYRVILKKIILTQKYSDGLSQQGESTPLESFALKKGTNEIRSSFQKSPSAILNHTFLNKFQFNDIGKKKDW